MTDILGKDYLTREEAAHYACLSLRKWDEVRVEHGITPIPWGGKLVYRKADIQRAIERACQQSSSGATVGSSSGGRVAGSAARALERRLAARPSAPSDRNATS